MLQSFKFSMLKTQYTTGLTVYTHYADLYYKIQIFTHKKHLILFCPSLYYNAVSLPIKRYVLCYKITVTFHKYLNNLQQ